MREPVHTLQTVINLRYTLTYSEGTRPDTILEQFAPDTPSHTVRERRTPTNSKKRSRYTLTYSEGTKIHITVTHYRRDTPSHTVREQNKSLEQMGVERYTLTYSEGTMRSNNPKIACSIHPHIQ